MLLILACNITVNLKGEHATLVTRYTIVGEAHNPIRDARVDQKTRCKVEIPFKDRPAQCRACNNARDCEEVRNGVYILSKFTERGLSVL